jgi:hypothetical protein
MWTFGTFEARAGHAKTMSKFYQTLEEKCMIVDCLKEYLGFGHGSIDAVL